jgi:signal transduction histidine kinase
MKDEFISLISHELRTPLTSINGYVALLLEGEAGPLAEEQREFLTIVRKNADRLMGLVNELLDLSRIEAGKVELNRARLDLGPLIRDVASSLRLQIEAKGQQLELDLADDLPSVWADPDRVTQILTNLVSNAHKYTPAGGSIFVRARGQDGRVRVEVRDTGIGLAPDEQAQLFTRFFRARNKATREVGGTGLGLAITRSLIELHGGEISVTSAPGQGSTFCCTLPAVQS